MLAKFTSPESYTVVSTNSHHSITNIVYIYINMWHQWVHSSINKINFGWWCVSSMFATNSNFDSIKFAPPTYDQPSNSQSTCCLLGKPNLGQWSSMGYMGGMGVGTTNPANSTPHQNGGGGEGAGGGGGGGENRRPRTTKPKGLQSQIAPKIKQCSSKLMDVKCWLNKVQQSNL